MNISDVEKLVFTAWSKYIDSEGAKFVAKSAIQAALQKDGRMNPLTENLRDLVSLKSSSNRSMEVKQVSDSLTSYDFNGNPAIAFIYEVFLHQTEISKTHGVAISAMKNTSGIHQLSSWVLPFAEADLVAYFRWNGGSYTTVPYGSKQSFFGTNPLAYAVPTHDKPLVCDMSTSEIPYMQLRFSKANELRLGPRQGLDHEGRETDDPEQVYNPSYNEDVRLLPMGGGYKGSALMLLGEILTGAFVGAKMSREASDEPLIPEEFGGLLQVFNPASLVDSDVFKSSVTSMAGEIRRSQTAHGHERVVLPGDSAHEREAQARGVGRISIDKETEEGFRNI